MSDTPPSSKTLTLIVVILGVVTSLGTIFIQVVKVGELKGTLSTTLNVHGDMLKSHEDRINGISTQVSNIEGRLRSVDALKHAPSSNVASRPPTPATD